MNNPLATSSCIYVGEVIHQRLRPTPHKLSYRVFSMLLDVDAIEDAARQLKRFSYNRFNLFSFYDRDHGMGDGEPVAVHARRLFADANIDTGGARILLLAYPRCLGAAFNPLSVYYCISPDGGLRALIYEVNNTFGQRRSYVVRAGELGNGGVYAQACRKALFVSPFAAVEGRYGFRVTAPGDSLLLGVQYYDDAGAVLRTHFRATAAPLTDATLGGLLWRFPLLTLKIVGGIHWEALKLWLKGVPMVQRPRSPRYAVTNVVAPSVDLPPCLPTDRTTQGLLHDHPRSARPTTGEHNQPPGDAARPHRAQDVRHPAAPRRNRTTAADPAVRYQWTDWQRAR
jgi:uncharacterized protein